jgi:hypothetical protein
MKKIYDAADKITRYIGGDRSEIALDHRGVVLTPQQVDKLVVALITQGYKNAVTTLQEAGERADVEGPDRNLTAWAVYVSAASFLEKGLPTPTTQESS